MGLALSKTKPNNPESESDNRKYLLPPSKTWNLAHNLHGHKLLDKDFTPKYVAIYVFFLFSKTTYPKICDQQFYYIHTVHHIFSIILSWIRKFYQKKRIF